MKKAFHIQLVAYAPILKNIGFAFKADEKTLMVGVKGEDAAYVLYLSCRTVDTIGLLKLMLPQLKGHRLPFRVIKDQINQYRLNSGDYGDEEVGKVLTVYIPQGAIELVAWIVQATKEFRGPVVPNALRIGEILYIHEICRSGGQLELKIPPVKKLPFEVPIAYLKKAVRKKFIGKYYLPVQIIKSSPKGDIYKAINLRKLAFTWCLVKEGKPVALDDHFNRDMRHRLAWQRDILQALPKEFSTAEFIEYFMDGDTSYLVTAFAEGDQLGVKIHELLKGISWVKLSRSYQGLILHWYLESINLVITLHGTGVVHRDITDSNLMVLKNGNLCLLDFELAYHMERHEPNPPFLLGTAGYAAPEQLLYAVPDFSEDVYSLGALLCFILTGIPPHELIGTDLRLLRSKLDRLTRSKPLNELAIRCLSHQRNQRPVLAELSHEITEQINQLKLNI